MNLTREKKKNIRKAKLRFRCPKLQFAFIIYVTIQNSRLLNYAEFHLFKKTFFNHLAKFKHLFTTVIGSKPQSSRNNQHEHLSLSENWFGVFRVTFGLGKLTPLRIIKIMIWESSKIGHAFLLIALLVQHQKHLNR